MRLFITILFLSALSCAFAQQQTGNFDYLTANRRFTLAGRTVKGISNDSIWLIASADSLVTQYAVKGYVDNHFGPGTSNAYNFNPEQFIVSGYDVSIRFPQDPGEPLFSNSASFNFTQRHLAFLDSLMLAVGEDTYLDDRDFYYSPDTLHPIRTKSFTLSTDGTGAASWDSVNKRLNIPVSSGGGGGSTGNYHLPYTGDSLDYIGGDTLPHRLPPTPPPGDSIDYSFTSMTTIYNEAGPGEYTISSSDVSFNKDNLQNPFRQLKALDVGGWNDGSYVSFKNTGNVNSTAYTFLRGFVRLKQTVPIIQSLSFRFYNAGVPVSQIVSMVNYGLDKSKINTYQNITIPMSAFQFSSNTFDEVRLIFGGGNSPGGLYLDLFQFQNATVNENIYVTDVFRVPGSTQVKKILGGQTVDAYTDSVGGGTSGWSLAGNAIQAGTSSTFGDFIGTTNLKSLRFRTNNTEYVVLDSFGTLSTIADMSVKGLRLGTGRTTDVLNTVFGQNALNATAPGTTTTAIGNSSFKVAGTSTSQNTGIGYGTGQTVTTGSNNTAIGSQAMYSTSTGASTNTAVGLQSLGQITGSNNVGIGSSAGRNAASGGVYLGNNAGQNETGSNKLYIQNSSLGGLVVGDFSTGQLQVNAEARNATAASSITSAATFEVNNNIGFANRGSIPAPRMTQAQRDLIALQTGVVTKIYVTATGGNATSAPTVTISGSGTGATATATVAASSFYVTVTNGGTGYTPNSTTVSITGGGTTGATGYAVVGNAGLQVICLDCIANDGTPTVLQTWNGTAWKNAW